MTCRRPWAPICAAVLCVALGVCAVAQAQGLSPEELEYLKRLSDEERAQVLAQYGAPPVLPTETVDRDVSTPEVVAPREIPESELEKEMSEAAQAGADGTPEEGLPLETVAADVLGPRDAFRDLLEESVPLTVDEDLRQFGYELFAGAPTTFAPATDIPVSPDYIIGPGDEIRVQLYGKTNLTTGLTVDRDGVIAFPDLGPIVVAGLTFVEMKDVVQREVENRMIGVDVSVSMGRLRSIRIFVLGEVFRPGSYTVSGLSTLTNALFASGGVEKIGSLRRVQLKRGGTLVQELDLYDLLIEGDTSADTRLLPGDVIFVPPVGDLVGIAGEVLRPAIYETTVPLTARDLIDLAGGLRATAYNELIQLERIEDGEQVTYDMSVAGAGEWVLQDGDLLKVFPILDRDENVVFLEGNVLRPGKRQYYDGMRLLDLVTSPSDLLPETHFDYGLLERENELNREPEYLGFNLKKALLDKMASENFALRPRDRVYIFHRGHFREIPMVSVRGEVRTRGDYAFRKDMRVLDLILAAGGLKRDAWLREAELFRTDPRTLDVRKMVIDLRGVLAGREIHNILLQDLDVLAVHSIWEFKVKEEVEILGRVNYPGTYPLTDGMRVSDLIFAGGNLHEAAYRKEAELTRYEVVDGERRELHHVKIDLEALAQGDADADIFLQAYDRLLIRSITNWRLYEKVRVTGEVAFPGSYPIEEGERLSNLITRFGGFLEDAYLPAAVLTREGVRELQAERLDQMADQLEADLARLSVPSGGRLSSADAANRQAALEAASQLVTELRNTEATGRMVIRFEDDTELRGSKFDVVLRDGDELHVPKRPDFVMVIGQVQNPSAFKYEKGKGVGHYTRLAGGKTRFGDLGKVFVVKADGSVEPKRTRVEPGDVIIVPENLERFAGMQFLLDISQVLYQLGIAAASAQTVGLF